MYQEDSGFPQALIDQELFSEANAVDGFTKEDGYTWPKEAEVIKKLEWFQDQKLGLMIHWGPYSQLGIEESWLLSDDDKEEEREEVFGTNERVLSRERYFDLAKTFNPVRFRPREWAEAASRAGFRYLIFTAKHHDGFTMWDSQLTDYKITSADCPFHTSKYADICKHLFMAMKEKGIGLIPYFSKADWHCQDYWNNNFERGDRTYKGPSYVVKNHPDMWARFESFTQGQILELERELGPLDGIWLDAGWVSAKRGQNIHMEDLIRRIRETNPEMLFIDRGTGGIAENYSTPEVYVPDKPMSIPWESCFPLGTAFSYRYDDEYKSLRELVLLLADVVSKGGNLALNIGPQPDGRLPIGALRRLDELGKWLDVYGEAIYNTRMIAPFQKEGVYFTKNRITGAVYAIRCYQNREEYKKDNSGAGILIPYTDMISGTNIYELKADKNGQSCTQPLQYIRTEHGIIVSTEKTANEVPARVFILDVGNYKNKRVDFI